MNSQVVEELERDIVSSDKQVVIFALEWCEFCWAVNKLLDAYGIPYRTINLDCADYQEHDRGRNIRKALNEKTSWVTMPLIFINGKFVGGCIDLFKECQSGALQTRLSTCDIQFDESVRTDPLSFLPTWLHPR